MDEAHNFTGEDNNINPIIGIVFCVAFLKKFLLESKSFLSLFMIIKLKTN